MRRLDGSKYHGKMTIFLKSTLNSNGMFMVIFKFEKKNLTLKILLEKWGLEILTSDQCCQLILQLSNPKNKE